MSESRRTTRQAILLAAWGAACSAAVLAAPRSAFADIFEWEYINPANPSLGKRQSTIVCPGGAGANAVPNTNLESRDLTMGYLIGANLTDANLWGADLTTADLSHANLNGTAFSVATLTNAVFTGADVRGAWFVHTNVTAAQLYSTASYQNHDLTGINLAETELSGSNFAGQNLTSAGFGRSTLTNANFSNANLTNADLSGNYGLPYLTNANFSNANLTNASLDVAIVTSVNFTGAQVRGASFRHVEGFTAAKLYSTASYQTHDLSGINLEEHNLSGWNFAGQNLTNAHFLFSTVTGANFTGAQVRGANFGLRFLGATNGITAAQLYSTATYQGHDLGAINLSSNDLSGWNFAGQNLANAILASGNLTSASFTGADVRGANFANSTGFTAAQLYSTATYQSRDLAGMNLSSNDLSGWNFSGQNLTSANLSGTTLTGADFTGAEVRGASFFRNIFGSFLNNFSAAQLYSTASYQNRDLSGINLQWNDLSGWNFAGQNLTRADLGNTTLTGADFTGAEVRGASFFLNPFYSYLNIITAAQLYSTASYQNHDLSGINLSWNNLSGWDFAGQNLSNAILTGINSIGADFTAADFRGASFGFPSSANARGAMWTNIIHPDGHVAGLDLTGGRSLAVRNYHGNPHASPDPGPIPIRIDQSMTMDPTGTLSLMLDGDAWDSTISFAPGIPVALGGTLELTLSAGVDLGALAGRSFDLFDWTGVTPTGSFAVASAGAWDLSRLYTTGRVTFGVAPAWDVDASGAWSTAGNWSGGATPGGVGAIAKFGSAITAPRTISVDTARTVGLIEFGNLNRYTLAGPAALTMDVGSGSASINVTTGSHTIAAPLVLNDDLNVIVAPAASVLTLSGPLTAAGRTITKAGAGRVDLPRVNAGGLNVNAGTARLAPGAGTSRVNSLAIAGGSAPTAQLDVTNNALVIDYASGGPSPLAMVKAQVTSGSAGGSWNGNGIVSSAANGNQFAVGYGEASALPSVPPVFGEVDASAVLVRLTRYGDADLNGLVNLQDFNRLASNFGSTNAVWTQGDFNYDGNVNLQDFNRLAGNFGLSAAGPDVTPADWAALASAVPEPACGVTVLALTGLLGRPRRAREAGRGMGTEPLRRSPLQPFADSDEVGRRTFGGVTQLAAKRGVA
jgi:uncharacterized protein YjbI with pentapeptide repeats